MTTSPLNLALVYGTPLTMDPEINTPMEKDTAFTNSRHVEDSEKSSTSVDASPNGEEGFKLTFGIFMAMLSFQLGYFSDTLVLIMLSAALGPINRDLGEWSASAFYTGTPSLILRCM